MEITGTFRSNLSSGMSIDVNDAFLGIDELDGLDGVEIVFAVKRARPEKVRTTIQNASLHKYLSALADRLNNAGFDQRGIVSSIGKGAPIPWSPFSMKALWKTIQLARHGKDSTTKMLSCEYHEEHRIFDMMISEVSGGVGLPLPSRESMSHETHDNL